MVSLPYSEITLEKLGRDPLFEPLDGGVDVAMLARGPAQLLLKIRHARYGNDLLCLLGLLDGRLGRRGPQQGLKGVGWGLPHTLDAQESAEIGSRRLFVRVRVTRGDQSAPAEHVDRGDERQVGWLRLEPSGDGAGVAGLLEAAQVRAIGSADFATGEGSQPQNQIQAARTVVERDE